MMLDLWIHGAEVYDGTGSPGFRADVAVRAGRIVRVGRVKEAARRRIQAAGLALCPGFVDVHTHADDVIRNPRAENVLRQGVTTVVSGNCGDSGWPIRGLGSPTATDRGWGALLEEVEAARPAVNYATLVGHGTIRKQVMGLSARPPARAELGRMRRLVEQSMRQGAVGISTGLFYVPGAYARLEELVELSRAAAAWGGVYASHTRSAGGKVFQAIREAATIGLRAGIGIEISHLKLFHLHRAGRTAAGRAHRVLAELARWRDRGADITYDTYPYAASYTSLSAVALPAEVSAGGGRDEKLKDPRWRRRIAGPAARRIAWMGGPERITLAAFPADRSLEGRTLAEVARARRQEPVAAAMDLVVQGDPMCIFHAMRPEDVDVFLGHELGMIASDGGVVSPRQKVVHPRNYGTFPRVLGEYVRRRGLLSLPQAVRKMTSMPARRFGLAGRGLLAEGMAADLVLFDPATVGDRATFHRPHAFPSGIRCVVVNGQVALDGRGVSSSRHGTVIRKT